MFSAAEYLTGIGIRAVGSNQKFRIKCANAAFPSVRANRIAVEQMKTKSVILER